MGNKILFNKDLLWKTRLYHMIDISDTGKYVVDQQSCYSVAFCVCVFPFLCFTVCNCNGMK